MPYKDRDKQREYARLWVAGHRRDWFADKSCVRCGSVEQLELDHVDPTKKVTHTIWSWSQTRREAELAKCQVLCHGCHVAKTRANFEHTSRLTADQVREIRSLHQAHPELTHQFIADQYGVCRRSIGNIITGTTWRHVT